MIILYLYYLSHKFLDCHSVAGAEMHSAVKNWLNRGELERLENVVLEGRGTRLLGEQSQDLRTRVFLKGLPNYLVSNYLNSH